MIKFIQKQKPVGGTDLPEDVTGALELATKFKWTAKARYALLVGDYPCHGK